MKIDLYGLSNLLTAITSSLIAILVYIKGSRNKTNTIWIIFAFAVALYGLGGYFASSAKNPSSAFFWWKISYVGVIMLPPLVLHFIYSILGIKRPLFLKVIYFLSFIILFFDIFSKDLFVGNVTLYFTNSKWFTPAYFIYPPGPLHRIYTIFFYFGLIILAHIELIRGYRRSKGIKRNQIKYFLFATILGFGGGGTSFLPCFGINFYPGWNMSVAFYPLVVGYAILKFHLIDIKVALTRAGVFIVVYSLVLGIPLGLAGWGRVWLEKILGPGWYWAPLILAIILATAGPFIYLALQRRAEKIILRAQKAYQDALREISFTMLTIKDIDRLLNAVVVKIVDLVGVSWAAIYLIDEKQKRFLLKHERSKSPMIGLPKEFSLDSSVVQCFQKNREPLMGEEILGAPLKLGLGVPCFMDGDMAAFILLGDKPKNAIYTQDDIDVFSVLANQTALAIENCQFYAQEREHHHLMRVASLDRQMASMAHEIDNPNQALLGCLFSLEMNLDDVKEAIPEEKMNHLKDKISKARFHTTRISKMIAAVREFSKPTTGELAPVNFQWIMEDFTTIIQPQIKHEGVTFNQEMPQEPIWLKANKVEIEQVLVNLATNSIQAIKELVVEVPDWKKEITLKAHKKDGNILRIDFSDTGSGIKKEILEDIFLDFVTTKASSVGTGLGLAISRKIMHKHNGKIWAESEGDNKGATFHLELPIAIELNEEEKQKAEGARTSKNKGATWFT